MKGLIMLFKHNLKFMIVKKKSSFLFTIIVPIIAVLVISKFLIGGSSYMKVGIVNNDSSAAANYVVKTLENDSNISVVKADNIEGINKDFGENAIQGAIIINKGFEQNLLNGKVENIKIIGKDGDSTYKVLDGMVTSSIDNILKLGILSKGNEEKFDGLLKNYSTEKLTISRGSVTDLGMDYAKASIFIGFLIMFVFYRAMFGAERINEDRDNKVFTRVFVSSIKPWQYYGGNVLASLVCISIQIILSVIAVTYVGGVNFGMSIPLISLILIMAGFIGISIGTACVSITRNTQEASMASNVIIFALVMLGGCFIPIKIFPPIMDTISKFLPTRWIMDMIYNIQNGQSFINQWQYIIMAILFNIALLLLAAYFTKRKDKSFLEV